MRLVRRRNETGYLFDVYTTRWHFGTAWYDRPVSRTLIDRTHFRGFSSFIVFMWRACLLVECDVSSSSTWREWVTGTSRPA